MHTAFRTTIVVLFVLLTCACGGKEQEQSPNNSTPELGDVELATNSAQPFAEVEVTGVPESFDGQDLYATYTVTEGKIASNEDLITVVRRFEDRIVLYAPFLFSREGGEVELRVTDGELKSEKFTLEIERVDDVREGAFRDAVSTYEDMFETILSSNGMTRDELDAVREQSDIPVRFGPLLRMQWNLSHPDNPYALTKLAEDPETAEMLDLVASATSMQSRLEDANAELSDEVIVDLTPGGPNMASQAIDPFYPIETPITLSDRMHRYARARATIRETERFNEIFGTYMVVASIATAGIGGAFAAVVNGAGRGLLGAADIGGEAARAIKWASPCCITNVRMTLDRLEVNEDQPPPAISILDVVADARTEKVNLTQEMVDRAVASISDTVAEGTEEKFGGVASTVGQDFVQDPALEKLTGDLSDQEVYMEWENIPLLPIGNYDWSDWVNWGAKPIAEGPLILDDRAEWGTFKLNENAFHTKQAIISVEPNTDAFPAGVWTPNVGASKLVEVIPIQVSIDPSSKMVTQRGESITFTIRVDHAHDKSIETPIEFSAGEQSSPVEQIDDGVYEVEWTSPTDPDDYPVRIRAQSASNSGIRRFPSAPPRIGRAFVTDDGYVELSAIGCLNHGETATIDARVVPQDTELDWSTTEGSVSSSGDHSATFTAPSKDTNATVTATSQNDDSISDQTSIIVRENCQCTYVLKIPGVGAFVGEDPGLTVHQQTGTVTLANLDEADVKFTFSAENAGNLSGESGRTETINGTFNALHPNPPPTSPGAYRVNAVAESVPAEISWNGEFDARMTISGAVTVVVSEGGMTSEYLAPVFVEARPKVDYFLGGGTIRQGNCEGELQNVIGQ